MAINDVSFATGKRVRNLGHLEKRARSRHFGGLPQPSQNVQLGLL